MKQQIFTILISLLLTQIVTAQSLETKVENGSLWQAKVVYDTLDNPIERAKIERFIYVENQTNIVILDMDEFINMSSGDMIVTYTIEGFNVVKEGEKYQIQEHKDEVITKVGTDSLYYSAPNYNVGFKKVNVPLTEVTLTEAKQYFFMNKVSEQEEGEANANYELKYDENGLVSRNQTGQEYSWSNVYRMIDFQGYIILKGAVAAPVFIHELNKNQLSGYTLDYRYEPKTVKYNIVK